MPQGPRIRRAIMIKKTETIQGLKAREYWMQESPRKVLEKKEITK